VTPLQRTAISEALGTFLAPTTVEDTTATLQRQRDRARSVPPVVSTVYPGQVIVRQGDVVNRAQMEELAALGLLQRTRAWQETVASLIFAFVSVAMLFWYLHAFHDDLIGNPRLLLLLDVGVLAAVVAARFVGPTHVLIPYFLPIAAVPTFAAVLLGPEAAVALSLCMALLAGWVTADSFELATYYFLTSAAGVLAVRHVRRLKQFIIAGGAIMLFAVLTEVAFGLIDRTYDLPALQDYAMAAVFNGFVSSTLALGGFALISGYFGVTTSLQLLELAQPSQPLLRRLMVKAPGTHNHSLIVGSMVEHAAEGIGADSLAAKVGALYHDVGKTANPHCFVENQLGEGNIHDELHPDESARIIRGHVVLGLRLARQHKLPGVVLDAIGEHHGTMSIAYFLHRAREYGDEPVDISLYTYPGPKPQSKETALIMLADGCESAVRAASDRSNERIRAIVGRIFQERIDLGQLNECPLTLRDLDVAREAFVSVLSGLYHPRVDYPETPADVPIAIRPRALER
jgi:putative nucleotidyltransferase with HDIG domain